MSFLWHGLTEQGAQVPVQVDAQGRVIAVDGTPGVSNWDRTNGVLSPAVPTDSVDIGSGKISLNASGVAEFAGTVEVGKVLTINATSAAVMKFATDNATKEWYVNDSIGDNGLFAYYDRDAGRYTFGIDYATQAVYIGTEIKNAATRSITLNTDGSATFAGRVNVGSNSLSDYAITAYNNSATAPTYFGDQSGAGPLLDLRQANTRNFLVDNDGSLKINEVSSNTYNISLNADGSATFAGNITAPNVTFRSADPQFYVKKSKNKDTLPEYVGPELDLLAEIARLEALVRHLYETLRLAPPAGWPVWDGNDDVLRQLRK